MKAIKQIEIVALVIAVSLFLSASKVNAASKAIKVVKNARSTYKDVNKKIKKNKLKKINSSDGIVDYYEKNTIRMTRCLKTTDYVSPKKCKVEFYYDKKHHPIFVFAWKKMNGKVKEYRAYFGKNGKCYRYIGANKKVHTYKNGMNRNKMPSMASEMLFKARMNLHYLGIYQCGMMICQ